MRTPDPMVCSMEAALKIIGEKWALVALREITFGSSRFSDILANTGAPRDILTARLKSLEAAGVIHRELYEQRPPRYDYRLSEAGEQLFGVLDAIRDWGDRYAREDPESIVAFRHSCGARLQPQVRCGACGEPLAAADVMAERRLRRSDLDRAAPAST